MLFSVARATRGLPTELWRNIYSIFGVYNSYVAD